MLQDFLVSSSVHTAGVVWIPRRRALSATTRDVVTLVLFITRRIELVWSGGCEKTP